MKRPTCGKKVTEDCPGDEPHRRLILQAHATLSRRRFLQGIGAVTAGFLVSCLPQPPTEILEPLTTGTPSIVPATRPIPTALSQVAIAQVESYDRDLVRQQVQALLDGLGGLDDVLSSGDRVAIKVNLTSGTTFEAAAGVPAIESYATHPEVVRALSELLRDAGAAQLFIIEAVYDEESYPLWGYKDVARELDATLIDLNHAHP
jgi:hypothetical protein